MAMVETASERRKREEEKQFAGRGVGLWQDAWRRLLRNRMEVRTERTGRTS